MLFEFPNEIIYNILHFCDTNSRKNLKLTSKFGYIICKDSETKSLVTLNKTNPNIIYKLCIKHCLFPYHFNPNEINKIEQLFLELKLRVFITNTDMNSMTKSFELFYKALKRG